MRFRLAAVIAALPFAALAQGASDEADRLVGEPGSYVMALGTWGYAIAVNYWIAPNLIMSFGPSGTTGLLPGFVLIDLSDRGFLPERRFFGTDGIAYDVHITYGGAPPLPAETGTVTLPFSAEAQVRGSSDLLDRASRRAPEYVPMTTGDFALTIQWIEREERSFAAGRLEAYTYGAFNVPVLDDFLVMMAPQAKRVYLPQVDLDLPLADWEDVREIVVGTANSIADLAVIEEAAVLYREDVRSCFIALAASEEFRSFSDELAIVQNSRTLDDWAALDYETATDGPTYEPFADCILQQ
ncbi:MAG: hypothetical protein KIS96_10760 [Bauldia sp.]|nr:hypothetical protein [Bauldia sp.]